MQDLWRSSRRTLGLKEIRQGFKIRMGRFISSVHLLISDLKMILAPDLKLIGVYIIYALQTTNTPTIHLLREDLRAILLDSITKDTVQWGRTVKSVVSSDNQQHTLTFTDDSKETFDLVVGADGAWSVVRPLLTPNQPVYTGVCFIDATISDVDNRFPILSAAAGPGMILSLAQSKSIMTQRQSHGYLRIYAAVRVPQSWSTSFKPTRDAVLDLYSDGWSPDLLEFLRSYDESSLVLRNIYALPVPTTWETQPGLTLIGDAAHLMSPFADEGTHFLLRFLI